MRAGRVEALYDQDFTYPLESVSYLLIWEGAENPDLEHAQLDALFAVFVHYFPYYTGHGPQSNHHHLRVIHLVRFHQVVMSAELLFELTESLLKNVFCPQQRFMLNILELGEEFDGSRPLHYGVFGVKECMLGVIGREKSVHRFLLRNIHGFVSMGEPVALQTDEARQQHVGVLAHLISHDDRVHHFLSVFGVKVHETGISFRSYV